MARIPAQKPFGVTQDSWTNAGEKGKIRASYRDRHEAIFGAHRPRPGHVTYKYIGGKRVEIENPATHGPVVVHDLTRLPPAQRLF